eukprot:Nitzschia sp. Nitz4//scaffold95_size97785//68154//70163//NITZ4_004674-RA/size97785-augustus-gene-0.110-mRNA-1//-1//CDS//3329560493//4594//frame0
MVPASILCVQPTTMMHRLRSVATRNSRQRQRQHRLLKWSLATSGLVVGTAVAVEAVADHWQDEFEQLPRAYERQQIQSFWVRRPVSIACRLLEIAYQLGPISGRCSGEILWWWFAQKPSTEEDEQRWKGMAVQLREALTNLGPAWIKGGQQLAIRPDIVPPVVLKELQRLCDDVRPVPDHVALDLLKEQLHLDDSTLSRHFQNIHLVASASLGQVYQAKLVDSGDIVAIKVQRPGMKRSFSLDLFLLQWCASAVDVVSYLFTKQSPLQYTRLVDTFSRGSYLELDYEHEARNQKLFQFELRKRRCQVKVPNVYDEYTTQQILTTEWIDGVKLAESTPEKIHELIPIGVELFLTQLLDIGVFHADPHPGNLLVTDREGMLCLLDFGLITTIQDHERHAMTKALVHLLCRDFDAIVTQDTKELGFLPPDFDTTEVKPILTKVLTGGIESGSDFHTRTKKLQEITNELNEVFFRFPFHIPPFFVLITRGLGLLEGIALSGDPEFDIFRASAPYARKRAMEVMGSAFSSSSRNSNSDGDDTSKRSFWSFSFW